MWDFELIKGQTAEELNGSWTKEDLYDYAKKLFIVGRSKMNKAQLAMAIEDAMKEREAQLEKAMAQLIEEAMAEQAAADQDQEAIFLVGFNFDAMASHAKMIGGYYEAGIYLDRVLGVKAASEKEAIKIFLEKRKNWITDFEKKYVIVMAECDQETWENKFYRNEMAWMRYMKVGEKA